MIFIHTTFTFELPFKEPVLVFTTLLLFFLLVPMLFNRLKIPDIIGLILAGAALGPNGFNILERGEAIKLLGTVGVIYIMFLAGLEIDLKEFKRSRLQSLQLGMLTFSVPLLLGFSAAYYLLHFSLATSILFGILFSPHTLVAYPIVRRLGVLRNKAVTVVMGSTLITDTLALLILALISESVQSGLSLAKLVYFIGGLGIYLLLVVKVLSPIARWFFRNVESSGTVQFLFSMVVVFTASAMAVIAGIEPIVGAFLAGLALNSMVPHASPLMARIEFTGNALFIPFFLISVGMLVDVRLFWQDATALAIAALMVGIATLGKLIPAYIMQKLNHYSNHQRNIVFGLSYSKAAAALAIAMVGFDLGIFNYAVQNGVIIVILVTCLIGPFIVENAAIQMALHPQNGKPDVSDKPERILVPIANPATMNQLIDFAILVKKPESKEPLIPLAVVTDNSEAEDNVRQNNKMLEQAMVHAATTNTPLNLYTRVDTNPASGIVRAAKEMLVTDVILGWSENRTTANTLFGSTLDNILKNLAQTILVVKLQHALNTVNQLIIALPPNTEAENGFRHSLGIIRRLAHQLNAAKHFYANADTINALMHYKQSYRPDFEYTATEFDDWKNCHQLLPDLQPTHLFIVCLGREHSVSYNLYLEPLPRMLTTGKAGFVIIYPGQYV
ncbi:MAG TPA: cation:proton antiporter [Chitinophagales bacterium]|nr:cation:proton antiporter [Chitinophagales bacterium]HRK28835.1 cation:proton antiporter [Chitinophagales bacterium]